MSVHVCHVHESAYASQKRLSDPLDLELQVTEQFNVGAKNWTWVFRKTTIVLKMNHRSGSQIQISLN